MKISIENYSKKIKNNLVLNDVSYQFDTGNIYLLEGINGSGKTMLLRAIVGLIKPTSGHILQDQNKLEDNKFLKDVGLIIGHTELLKDYTGLENLKIINKYKGNVDSDKELMNYLTIVGLDTNNNQKVAEYSLGMNQKLALAQTLIGNPDVLILDEPLNSLDKSSSTTLINYLSSIKKSKIIIIAAHNSLELKEIADYLIEMDAGEIVNE